MSLNFTNVSFAVPTKVLLHGVSAEVSSGEVLAILGPSGAGKTVLLDALTLKPRAGVASGQVTLNGHPFTVQRLKAHCAVVGCYDSLWPALSCTEHVRYAVALHRPALSNEERTAEVDALLRETGLVVCADTIAGNEMLPGLSSGQRRRLSLAVALAKQPALMFLDEPTSGLDAAAAIAVTELLNRLARAAHVAVVATIHQPAASVFATFDRVLIISRGQVAYYGAAGGLGPHLAAIGRRPPADVSAAEAALNLVNADFAGDEAAQAVIDEWTKRAPMHPAPTEAPLPPMPPPAGIGTQLGTLVSRHSVLAFKDPQLYLGRTFGLIFQTTFLGLFFINAMPRTQEQIFNRFMFIFSALVSFFGGSMLAVILINAEARQVASEVRHHMYHVLTYVCATTLIQLLAFVVMAALALLPGYAFGAWDWASYGQLLLLSTTYIWVYECLGSLFALIDDPKLGFMLFAPIMGATFWFAGIVLRGDDLIWPLRLLYYGFASKWFMESSIYLLVHDDTFDGAVLCPTGEALAQLNTTDAAQCLTRGFYCPDAADRCYGHTGTQVLDSFSHIFPVVSSHVDWALDWAVMAAIVLAFKLLFAVLLHRKATRVARMAPLKREALIADFKAFWAQPRPALSEKQLREVVATVAGAWSMTHNLDRDEWLRKGRILGMPPWMASMQRDTSFDISYAFDFLPDTIKVSSTVKAGTFFKNTSSSELFKTSTQEVKFLMFQFGVTTTSTFVGSSLCTEMKTYRLKNGERTNEVTSWSRQTPTMAGTIMLEEYTFNSDGLNSFMRMELHPITAAAR